MTAVFVTLPWLRAKRQGCGCLMRPSRTYLRRSSQSAEMNCCAGNAPFRFCTALMLPNTPLLHHSNCPFAAVSVEASEEAALFESSTIAHIGQIFRLYL